MQKFIRAGYYFSVNSNMCTTSRGKRIISEIPLDKILVESDGPFTKVGTHKYSPVNLQDIYSILAATIGVQNIENIVFSNGVFYLYQYEFADPQNYNSLVLVKQKNYILSPEITLADIQAIIDNTPICSEAEVAFPQADSMKKIVNLMEMLSERDMTKQDITNRYIFRERQTNYYTTAGHYLGFIEKGERRSDGFVYFSLSDVGRHVMKMPYRERQIAIATAILRHKAFNETLKIHLQCGEMPKINMIVQIMQNCGVYNVGSPETFKRRASTIRGWVEWILGLIEGE